MARRQLADETDTPVREQDKLMLRLPDGMRDRLKAAAKKNERSMNAEIVATLEEKYPAPVESAEVQVSVAVMRKQIGHISEKDPKLGKQLEEDFEEFLKRAGGVFE